MAAVPTQLGLVEIDHVTIALPAADAMKVAALLRKAIRCRYSRYDERTKATIWYAEGPVALQLVFIGSHQLDGTPMAPARTGRKADPLMISGDAP
ncbi:MAG: hypothetical protein LCH73_02800 [Proteobacteria bacterium]|nr:hypothetical protein [Pseudomonadota bacterium]